MGLTPPPFELGWGFGSGVGFLTGCRVFDPTPLRMKKGFVLRFTVFLSLLLTGFTSWFSFWGGFVGVLASCRVLHPRFLGLLGLTGSGITIGGSIFTFWRFGVIFGLTRFWVSGLSFTFWGPLLTFWSSGGWFFTFTLNFRMASLTSDFFLTSTVAKA